MKRLNSEIRVSSAIQGQPFVVSLGQPVAASSFSMHIVFRLNWVGVIGMFISLRFIAVNDIATCEVDLLENESMIEVKNLTKMFNDFTAVDSISFDVRKGEIFGLLGPNGAGKSTTIRMLCTLSRPTKGTATIGGYDIVKDDTQVRKLVGIVSEKMIMYDRLTARENLQFFGSLFGIPKNVLDKRIDDLLELVQLTKWKNSLVGTFSTGMRQRMNVIRALLNMPQVLFLDEPTLGLDPQSTVEIREFIKKINRENTSTILITTHMMGEADLLCDRIGIIDHGKIVALDTSTNLKRMIQGANTTILTLEISHLTPDLIATVRGLECVEAVSQENSSHLRIHAHGDDAFDTIVDAVRARKVKIDSIQNLQPTLEDVFLHVTGHEVRDSADRKIPMGRHRHFGAPSRVR
jgi:ABC-2 type transport system ATP-binding protein